MGNQERGRGWLIQSTCFASSLACAVSREPRTSDVHLFLRSPLLYFYFIFLLFPVYFLLLFSFLFLFSFPFFSPSLLLPLFSCSCCTGCPGDAQVSTARTGRTHMPVHARLCKAFCQKRDIRPRRCSYRALRNHMRHCFFLQAKEAAATGCLGSSRSASPSSFN